MGFLQVREISHSELTPHPYGLTQLFEVTQWLFEKLAATDGNVKDRNHHAWLFCHMGISFAWLK